jgi:hypothetical protein
VRVSINGILHRAYANTTTWSDGTARQFDHSISPAVTSIHIGLEIKD